MAEYQNILFDLHDGIARLTLHRPDKLNSFNPAMHLEVRDAITRTRDAHARVLVLTGSGRGFCAGQDLGDRAVAPGSAAIRGRAGSPGAPGSAERQAGGVAQPCQAPRQSIDLGASIETFYAPLVRSLQDLPLPVVCAVNGIAAGAGANLALACDLVLATESAYFYEPFCKLGLVPDTGGTFFLPRLIGTARAMAMMMLGERISAPQAAAWGMIWRAIPDAEFAAAVDALAAQLAEAPTRGLAAIKRALQQSAANTLAAQLNLERDCDRELGLSRDYAEGVAAFLEKRKPRFTGK
ncbi:MAG: enoyl-CoA hydratase-related protein [Terriglobales bacterium]